MTLLIIAIKVNLNYKSILSINGLDLHFQILNQAIIAQLYFLKFFLNFISFYYN